MIPNRKRFARMIAAWAAAGGVALLSTQGGALAADGEVTFGTQDWNQSEREAKFEEFRAIPMGPFVESFSLTDRMGPGRYALFGNDALQNDQTTTVLYRRSRWTAFVDYQRIPHNFSFLARTPYTEIAPGVLALPDSLQRMNQTNSGAYVATMTDRLNSSPQIPLGFRTDLARARVKARLARGLLVDVRGSRRQRDGTKAFGGSFGFSNAVEITEPIRQTMDTGEARASYTHQRVTVEATGAVEQFLNETDVLIVDNPRRYTDSNSAGSSKALIDLYPDNRTVRGSLGGSVQFPHRTTFTGVVGVATTKQHDKWRRLTANTAILQPDSFPLPGTNSEAKAVISTQDLRLTSAALGKASGTIRYRRQEYDNQTPKRTIRGQVAYDQTWQPATVTTHPIGFTNTAFGADVDVTPIPKAMLSGTIEQIKRERTYREVAEDKELVLSGKARVRPHAGWELTGRYRHGNRELDHFEEEDYENAAGAFVEQPTLRRFDVADRKQDMAGVAVGWSGIERVQLSLSYDYERSKYHDRKLPDIDAAYTLTDTSETQLGLLDETRRSIAADGTFEVSDRLTLTGGYGWVAVGTNQRSRESGIQMTRNDSTTWQARVKDWFVYATGSATWTSKSDRVTLSLTYDFDRSPGVYILRNFRGTAQDLAGTLYRRESVGAESWYKWSEGTSVGLRWEWEQFHVDDFSNEKVPFIFPTTGASTALFLGDSYQDYRAHTVGVLLRRTF